MLSMRIQFFNSMRFDSGKMFTITTEKTGFIDSLFATTLSVSLTSP